MPQVKDLALQLQSDDVHHAAKALEVAPVVDETISLWSRMQEAEVRFNEKLVHNVHSLQATTDQAVRSLREQLKKLHSISRSAVSGSGDIAAQEASLSTEATLHKNMAAEFKAALASTKAELEEAKKKELELEELIASLRKKLKQTQDELAKDEKIIAEDDKTIKEESAEIEALKKKLKQAEDALAKSKKLVADKDKTIEEEAEEISSLNAKLAELQKKFVALEKQYEPCPGEKARRRRRQWQWPWLRRRRRKIEEEDQLLESPRVNVV